MRAALGLPRIRNLVRYLLIAVILALALVIQCHLERLLHVVLGILFLFLFLFLLRTHLGLAHQQFVVGLGLFDLALDQPVLRPWPEVLLVVDALHTEVYDGPADLHGLVEARHQWRARPDQHQRAELGQVVLQLEPALLQLDDRVAPRHRYVVDPQIRLMSPAQLERLLLVVGPDHVDYARRVLLLVQTLQHQEVAIRSLVVHQVVGLVLRPQHQGVRLLADLALERFPVVRGEVGTHLALLLHVEPVLQTVEVDVAH